MSSTASLYMVWLVMMITLSLSSSARIRKVWDCSSGTCNCREVPQNGKIITVSPVVPVPGPVTTTPSTTPILGNQATLCTPPPTSPLEGCWTYYAHQTNATRVTFISDNQVEIDGFVYDDVDPDAFWTVKLGSKPKNRFPLDPCSNYTMNQILADHKNACKPVEKQVGTKITLTLAANIKWDGVAWIGISNPIQATPSHLMFGIYSYKDGHLFGYIDVPNFPEIGRISPNGPSIDCRSTTKPTLDIVTCDTTNTFNFTRTDGTVESHP